MTHESVDLAAILLKGNRIATFLSTYVGSESPSEIKRYDIKLRKIINIPCPSTVKSTIIVWVVLTMRIVMWGDIMYK